MQTKRLVRGVFAAAVLVGACGFAGRAQAQYCAASSGVQCGALYEFISNVQLGGINNSSLCSAPSYEDYSAISTTMAAGQSMNISVTIGTPYTLDECTVWVDWDNNGSFDDYEAVPLSFNPYPVFTGTITVPPGTAVGLKRMRVRLTYDTTPAPCGDSGAYGNIEDYSINVANADDPLVAGNPATGTVGSPILLTAIAIPGHNPDSTTLHVTGDLSSIGGPSSQAFYDDGTHGDVNAGDGTFSYMYAVPHGPGQAAGQFAVPLTVVDNLNRTSSGAIGVTLAAEAVGGCCTGGSCSVTTAYACAGGGGTYQGDGSTCGVPTYNVSTTSNQFVDISGSGTQEPTTSGCDDCTAPLSLPFPFQFYGNVYNGVNVCSNGNLQFGDTPSTAWVNDTPPTAATPNNAIYPMWDDLYFTTGGIYYQTDGTAPNRTFTVAWINREQYVMTDSNSFEAVLYEGSNNIEFRYGVITPDAGGGGGPGGSDYTIGIENSDGTDATTIMGSDIGSGGTARMLTFVPPPSCGPVCGSADFNNDGDSGTDLDIEDFFACIAGNCCPTCGSADFNGDGDTATDADIEAFFRVLAGGNC